jgi:hypothetical protein
MVEVLRVGLLERHQLTLDEGVDLVQQGGKVSVGGDRENLLGARPRCPARSDARREGQDPPTVPWLIR